ncbi:MAG: VPLPA-CTERM sorting domain-containing protein [Methylococcaceae bacterium]|nr:VPLPA-CTERM sorting domain-containing protein [Methylococcaceae bacterium]
MKVKALVAGLLLAAAGTSHAALIANGVTEVHGGTPAGVGPTADVTHGGDLFLVVLDETNGNTYFQNLNTDMVAFKNTLSLSNQSFAIDALGQPFLSSATDTYHWAVFADNSLRGVVQTRAGVTNYGNVADWGFLTTGGNTGTAAGFAVTNVNVSDVVNTKLPQNVIANANTGLALSGTNSAVFLPGDLADFSKQGGSLAASQIFNGTQTNAAFSAAGSDISTFWYVSYDALHKPNFPTVNLLGNLTLTTNQLSFATAHVSNVPVPAAIWLLGSALAGFATVARREKKA